MKKLALLSTFVLMVSSLALLTQTRASKRPEPPRVAETHDQDKDEVRTCSNETLEGVYGLSITGTRPAPPPPAGSGLTYIPGTIEQLIGVESQTFDGEGNFTQIDNVKGSLSGILVPNHAVAGIYSVNPDCSGTITLTTGVPFTIVLDIVIVDHGKEFRGIVASPPAVMVSANGRRVN